VASTWGRNVYQNRGGTRTFTDDNPNSEFFGSTLEVFPKNDVGFFGGVKLGYVFGTGWIRPTIEGDFFYKGFKGGANFTPNEASTPCPGCATEFSTHQRDANTWINTGAFLANFILRFAPGCATESSSRISVQGSAFTTRNRQGSRS
jgi:hypothetical protein